MIQGNRLKALAVTGSRRSDLLPNVPTVAESGIPGFEASGWFGLFAPAGTPAQVQAVLGRAMNNVLKNPEVLQQLSVLGGTPLALSGDAFRTFAEKERSKWKAVIDAHQLKPGE